MANLTLAKAVRIKCLDCSGGSVSEVKLCPITDCILYTFRLGRNPNRKPLTDAQKAKLVQNLRGKKE